MYEKRPLKAPRLAGSTLRIAVALMEGPLGGPLRRKTLADLGLERLRTEHSDAPFQPLPATPLGMWTGAHPAIAELGHRGTGRAGLPFESVADFASAYEDGRADPVTVAERLIAAVEASERNDPPLRILIAQDQDDLRRQAKAAKARLEAGRPRSRLDGVPVAVKDEVDMVPYPTTMGTRIYGMSPASADATCVARLRAAGALLFGKTNMHEIGINPTGFNPHYGACRNPYAPDHDSGGSSSGVAAALAAGMAPLGLGADGGGSIRVPAAHCGLVGLKPTFGRVSGRGAASLAWSVGQLGPLAVSAADCALGYALLAGRDDQDPMSQRQPDVSLAGFLADDLAGVRLGVYSPWFEDADPAVVATCRAMLDVFKDRGAIVTEIEIPEIDRLQLAHALTITSEMLASQRSTLATRRKHYAANTRLILALAEGISGADYVQCQRTRALFQERFRTLLETIDALVTPTSACTAPLYKKDALPGGESDVVLIDKLMRFVHPANFLGLPSISFPAGYDDAGLPIGFMATGRAWEEALLLRLARISEAAVEHRAPRLHRRLLA